MRRLPCFASVLLLTSCSPAGEPEVTVTNAWVRPAAAAGQMTAGYALLRNSGGAPDTLVSASSPDAASVTLHNSSSEGGVARMRPIAGGLEIIAGSFVALRPGAGHLMLEELKRPVNIGDTVQITFHFERSGDEVVDAEVRNASPAAHGSH